MTESLLEITNLVKYFQVGSNGFLSKKASIVRAVDDISFTVNKGETLGLVGESGCGKSTTGRLILNLLKPTSGSIFFDGLDLGKLNLDEMRELRRHMQIVFQDPYASLNPRMSVGDIIGEALEIHKIATGKQKKDKVLNLLEVVGLTSEHAKRYPHEFSGGQRQRIGVARALAVNPKLIVCDEPVSALDVSIQAQVINLLQDLQKEFGLTYIFIAHDLSVVKHISNRVAVMYLGKIVELADKNALYENPVHPYTRALLSAIPVPDPSFKKSRILLDGDVPSPINPPSGCRFRTRCKYARELCSERDPEFVDIGSEHFVACHFHKSVC